LRFRFAPMHEMYRRGEPEIIREPQGTCTVRILTGVVAGGRPRAPGDEVTVPMQDALLLIRAGSAERIVEAPRLMNL
jgi:hypothetical protein